MQTWAKCSRAMLRYYLPVLLLAFLGCSGNSTPATAGAPGNQAPDSSAPEIDLKKLSLSLHDGNRLEIQAPAHSGNTFLCLTWTPYDPARSEPTDGLQEIALGTFALVLPAPAEMRRWEVRLPLDEISANGTVKWRVRAALSPKLIARPFIPGMRDLGEPQEIVLVSSDDAPMLYRGKSSTAPQPESAWTVRELDDSGAGLFFFFPRGEESWSAEIVLP